MIQFFCTVIQNSKYKFMKQWIWTLDNSEFTKSHPNGPFTRSVFKDPILVGSETRIVWTHQKWPSVKWIRNFEKTNGNRTCSIFIQHSPWKMKGTHKFCMIVLAPNWRFFVSSEKRIVWTHYNWPADIFTTKTEPWNRTVWTPASSFWNQKSDS